MENKKSLLANEKIFHAIMIKDRCIYSIEEIINQGLEKEEFISINKEYALTYVDSYERKGRKDRFSDGSDKPKVKVSAHFKKKISLKDYRELNRVNSELKKAEQKIHSSETEWHKEWKERVRDFCCLEKRFSPKNESSKSEYRKADAYYSEANTVIEFQKSFNDESAGKTKFYKEEKKILIWLFYLQTLEVFEDDNRYKIREDNFYHFFRIDNIYEDFYKDSMVFIQDKNKKIYHLEDIYRETSSSELEPTIRYFNKSLCFNNSDEFANWLKYEWKKSDFYKKRSLLFELKSLDEILRPLIDSDADKFYLQNCWKNDKNGKPLIYCFEKNKDKFKMINKAYISYRCYINYRNSIQYFSISDWNDETKHNCSDQKWILLATNKKRYRNAIDL